jgi:hypothetical protein
MCLNGITWARQDRYLICGDEVVVVVVLMGYAQMVRHDCGDVMMRVHTHAELGIRIRIQTSR